ncbi:MAG: lamin tail domain-containing protein [Candidatus Aminicenantes bacterium]|nr:MAG: lamin tail domain-containing protein [Candidatus Aminicenantes bacterium]
MNSKFFKHLFFIPMILIISSGLSIASGTNGSSVSGTTHVVFSVILYDSDADYDADGEWIELYNPTFSAVDIGGWTIEDNYKSYTIPSGTTIGIQSYLVIANDQAEFYSKYGCDPDISGLTLGLNNDGDYLTLKNNSGTVLDRVAWESGGSNISGWGSSSQPYADEGKSITRANVNQDTDTYADWLNNQDPNPCNLPYIVLNRTQLNFGASTGVETGAQTFAINYSGEGTPDWSVSTSANWIGCSPTSGVSPDVVSVSVNSTGLSTGTYTGTITISDPNAINSPQTLPVTLQVYKPGFTSAPFGDFATPIHGSLVRSSIPVTGWVLDDIEVVSVKIYNGPDYVGDAVFVEGARPDVEQAYPGYPKNYQAGWGYMMLTYFLPNGGNGTYTIYAKAIDAEGNQMTLGSKTIHVDNANAVKPFGAIDTPVQGGTASGSNYINWGWVLTPQPNCIPTDGSTINVYVDGVNLGHPTYNIYRSDIASMFPYYCNSNGAVGYFYLDTTAYENGVHTIQWTAADNAGNTDGIGSRYFTIQNTGGSAESTAQSAERKTAELNVNLSPVPGDYYSPILVKKGYNQNIKPHKRFPDKNGNITIEIKELERIEIHLLEGTRGLAPLSNLSESSNSHWKGFNVIGNQLRPLPIGSFLDDEKGIFYWQPGVGFLGTYEFVFIKKSTPLTKKNINIRIVPKNLLEN